jgi:hypothetical protein
MHSCLDLLQERSLSFCLQDHLTGLFAEKYTRNACLRPIPGLWFWVGFRLARLSSDPIQALKSVEFLNPSDRRLPGCTAHGQTHFNPPAVRKTYMASLPGSLTDLPS